MDKETIRRIKSRFFAMRNGVVADRLRKAGSPYKIIFGLLIPQIEEIAAGCEPSDELADALWDNSSTRESRLLAVMVQPLESFTEAKAAGWVSAADTVELIDQLCFRLVRNMASAERVAVENMERDDDRLCYFAYRLAMNLLVVRRLENVDAVYAQASRELQGGSRMTAGVCRQLVDEIDWMRERIAASRESE